MCIYVYIYMNVYMYKYTYKYVYIYIYKYTCTYRCIDMDKAIRPALASRRRSVRDLNRL